MNTEIHVSISMGRKGISPAQITISPGSSETKAEQLNWRKLLSTVLLLFSQDDSLFWQKNYISLPKVK